MGSVKSIDVSYFRSFGFLVLRKFFHPQLLTEELDRVMTYGLRSSTDTLRYDEIQFQYVPMMTAETAASLALLDQTEVVARALLGRPVLPTRAKGVRYFGNTPWHVDSTSPIASIGIAAYLEPLGAATGALRVLPGSHRPEFGDAVRALGGIGKAAMDLPSYALDTEPGDIIVFDEHLFHASCGGGTRRQWRIDYLEDPVDALAEEQTKAYFAGIYQPQWARGYDAERCPSYGPEWLSSERPVVRRLETLGVYALAIGQ